MDTRTRIIATVGPATDAEGVIDALIAEGVDVFRLNFSHGTHEEHAHRMDAIKRARKAAGSSCAILLDTKGPEIRTGLVEGGCALELAEGDGLVLVPDDGDIKAHMLDDAASAPMLVAFEGDLAASTGRAFVVPQSFAELADYIEPGARILLDDGKVELVVAGSNGTDIACRVLNSAPLGQRKSLNVPGVSLPLPTISAKDEADLRFGIEQGVDFVAASFVKSGDAVRQIRTFLHDNGGDGIGIISKIENKAAVDDIEDIVQASDGVMVARGDLGVEMPLCEVPHLQKEIICKCNQAHRPVITATQMLESMTENPRPTRAEMADVANAIYDGSDCVMLSGETAVGKYPVQVVQTMSEIIDSTERHIFEEGGWRMCDDGRAKSISHAVGSAAVQTAEGIRAKCLICPTMTGRSARLMSSLRPPMQIYAVAANPRTMRQMQIFWGVISLPGAVQGSMRKVIETAQAAVCSCGYLSVGDVAVLTCGDRFTSPVTRDEDGKPEKFAPANVMYVLEIRDDAMAGEVASYGDDALTTANFFNLL